MHNFFKALHHKTSLVRAEHEYKLYYNKETGKPLFYSMGNNEGDFIAVDKELYCEANYNVHVKDGKLVRTVFKDISKLTHCDNGTTCHADDVSIISATGTTWSLRTYDN